jgi:transmembrane sensor
MSADSELHAIEEVAAGWMVERDRGLTPAREREFERWLRADARHAATFRALAETWQLIGEAPPTRSTTVLEQRRRRRAWLPLTLAAAASLAIAAYLGWFSVASGTLARARPFALNTSTTVGEVRKLELPDGSVIQLNTDSAVDVRFEPTERRVRLTRGEAHFSVAKNAERPFIVSAAGIDVRVVGTVFNVRLRSESVDVLVTEGKVRVGSKTETTSGSLSAGQKVSIVLGNSSPPAVPAPVDVAAAEIKQTLAWQARRLDFDATPLREIVAEINRYNRHKLVVADPRLDEQRFGGSFPANDYQTFVRMLEADFGVVAERKADETLLRLKAR